jgi:hypothetical protein
MNARPIPRELLPPDFRWALMRLEQRYGAALRVNVTDANWMEISVENVPAVMLAAQLQNERKVLFGAAEPRMQIISPLRPTGNEVCLHLLTEPNWGDRRGMMSGK